MKLKINSNPDIFFDTKTLSIECIGVDCSRCSYSYHVNKGEQCIKIITKKAFKLLEKNIKGLIKLL